jgi:hypothetical protein
MKKRPVAIKIMIFIILAMVVLCSTANADWRFVGTTSADWTDASNWGKYLGSTYGSPPPVFGENVQIRAWLDAGAGLGINTGGFEPVVGIGKTANCSYLQIKDNKSLTVNGTLNLGGDSGYAVVLLGTVSHIGAGATGTLNINAGIANLGEYMNIGSGTTSGILNMSNAGVLDIGTDMNLAAGSVNLTSGLVDITGALNITGGLITIGQSGELRYGSLSGNSSSIVAAEGLSLVYGTLGSQTVVTAIPEPATMALLALGGMFLRKRK